MESNSLDEAVLLITGGSGSLGNALIKEINNTSIPKKVIIYSRDECKQHHMQQEYKDIPWLRYQIGNVRDRDRLMWSLRNVDYVIHAAALKQIGAAEYNPMECVKTNIGGSSNVIDACMGNDVKRAVLISTDKACMPVNLYGATKMTAERLFLASNSYHKTLFRAIRYGNVLNSRGSVVELFLKLKEQGIKKFPITDLKMTRFFWTLQQAAQAVIKTLLEPVLPDTEPGLWIPKLASMKITDLARAIDPDCEFEVIGRKQGEKLHESLKEGYSSDTNSRWLTAEKIRKIFNISFDMPAETPIMR